jgi:hypothetical protein
MVRAEGARRLHPAGALLGAAAAFAVIFVTVLAAQSPPPSHSPVPTPANVPFPIPLELVGVELGKQTDAEATAKSAACVGCHQGARDPHYKATVRLGCTDCHGGTLPEGNDPRTHVGRGCPAAPPSRNPDAWRAGSANPVRSYTLLNHENPDLIRFVNPGDLRVSHISCGTTGCHAQEVRQVHKSMMTHGCMLWGSALYNNGAVPFKVPRFGEFYSMNGVPLRAQTVPPPTPFEMKRGVIPFLDPLPRFEVAQPGNVLRIFERGGMFRPEVGLPEPENEPGRPILNRLSVRGLGTENRTDPVVIGLQKTRLFDPTLNFLGTNEQAGDYRSSGCTACHVVYANDRSRVHAGPYAKYGNRGLASALPEDEPDPMIRKDEPGHPVRHRFVPGNGVPTSQCMVCHIHPGTTVMNSAIGYMWWDEETDGEVMYPPQQKYPSAQEYVRSQMANPDEVAVHGNWSDPEFLANLTDLNPRLKHTYFADFHSHGWAFRAVFRRDRKGNLLDYNGNRVEPNTPAKMQAGVDMPLKIKELYRDGAAARMTPQELEQKQRTIRQSVPMHLLDVHAEKGMHCVDCHFVQDAHGNTRLQMEVRAAIEIQCVDCHGTVTERARLRTSGPAAYTSNPSAPSPADPKFGRDLAALRTPSGKPRFERRGDKIIQNSMVEPGLSWEVVQTKDTIDPKSPHYNAKSAVAKTVRFENDKMVWGEVPPTPARDDSRCAHANANMTCTACHSSWNPSCYGCHLPQKANMKMPQLHNEGGVTRNYVPYNWQTLRDEVYMLARDGNATCNRINPARSSCAIHVGSYNQNRESIYVQQQTISAEGFSGVAFSTNVPHTFSAKGTTKSCTDCHISNKDDNNALVAQLLMHGTGYLNFIGRYCWVGTSDDGPVGVTVTERDEPQAVIGSYLHQLAFPDYFAKHLRHDRVLQLGYEHPGRDISEAFLQPGLKYDIRGLLARGEYLYAACGDAGTRIFDISFIDHKGFSERFFTAPVSPCGQQFYVKSKFATAVAAPCTPAPDPTRTHYVENCEGRVHAMYGNIYITDKYEGLIIVGVATLLDGNPLNNFLHRDVTFNPDNILAGANSITIVGTYAYITCDAGLVVVSIDDPKKPVVKSLIDKKLLKHPRAVATQFRYAYVADEEGVKVFDITNLSAPRPVSKIAVPGVQSIYLARTYAYLAAGKLGLVILDIERPEKPVVDQVFNADGCIDDLHDVKLGITYTSEFAYLADGKHGLRVVQLTTPDTPGNQGFSPRPTPQLIATYPIPHRGHAVAISRGLDRDRAVDESGNQIGVFGRVGARPLNLAEQQKLYLHNGKVWKVSDDPNWAGYLRAPPKP